MNTYFTKTVALVCVVLTAGQGILPVPLNATGANLPAISTANPYTAQMDTATKAQLDTFIMKVKDRFGAYSTLNDYVSYTKVLSSKLSALDKKYKQQNASDRILGIIHYLQYEIIKIRTAALSLSGASVADTGIDIFSELNTAEQRAYATGTLTPNMLTPARVDIPAQSRDIPTPTATLDNPSQVTTSWYPIISGTANVSDVYVNIVNSNGNSIAGTGKVPVINGHWSGSVASTLPALMDGAYTVRVYNASDDVLLARGTITKIDYLIPWIDTGTWSNEKSSTATLDNPNQFTTSGYPVISGTANVSAVYANIVNGNGNSIAGIGSVPVVNGHWSGSVVSTLPALTDGKYTVEVYNATRINTARNDTLLATGTITKITVPIATEGTWSINAPIWSDAVIPTQYPLCDALDIIVWSSTIAACNVGATKSWLGTESYGSYYQSWKNTSVWDATAEDSYDSSWTAGAQWPCLAWYHVPTRWEWVSVLDSFWFVQRQQDAVAILQNKLKLPFTGTKISGSQLINAGLRGVYQTSSSPYDFSFFGPANINPGSGGNKTWGKSVRCFKDKITTSGTASSYSVSGTFGAGAKWAVVSWCNTFAVADSKGNFTFSNVPNGTNCANIAVKAPGYECVTNANGPTSLNGNVANISGACTFSYYPGSGWAGKCEAADIVLPNGQVWAACNVGTRLTWEYEYGNYYQWGNNIAGWSSDNMAWKDDNAWWDITNTSIARQWPCASGYHVPSQKEWQEAYDSTRLEDNASNSWQWSSLPNILGLSKGGYRYFADGSLQWPGMNGSYWSSTPGVYFFLSGWNQIVNPNMKQTRNYAATVRCMKN